MGMKINNTLKFIISLIIPQLAGGLGSYFTAGSVKDWYPMLVKPALNPPSWVFGPVWTTLFILMGISAFLIWSSYTKATEDKKKGLERKDVKIALGIFIGQLVLNTFWSIIFFGLHSPVGAFFELIVLWFAILIMIISFYKISRPAAWLLLPYILWVSFAGYLNYSIWQLNSSTNSGQVACTLEAKLCPDGSYVGRTGPKCEFKACPGENNNLWVTVTDSKTGIAFLQSSLSVCELRNASITTTRNAELVKVNAKHSISTALSIAWREA